MLACSHKLAAQVCPGGMIYWFIEWWQIAVLTRAVPPVIGAPRDLIVWVRSDARPGTFYSSQYDQVAVFVVGDGPPLRAAQRGRSPGRLEHEPTHRPQARCARDRHSQGLLRTRRYRARSVRGLGHHHDRGRAHRPLRAPLRTRSALVRCHRAALGEAHQGRGSSRRSGDVCGNLQRARGQRSPGGKLKWCPWSRWDTAAGSRAFALRAHRDAAEHVGRPAWVRRRIGAETWCSTHLGEPALPSLRLSAPGPSATDRFSNGTARLAGGTETFAEVGERRCKR